MCPSFSIAWRNNQKTYLAILPYFANCVHRWLEPLIWSIRRLYYRTVTHVLTLTGALMKVIVYAVKVAIMGDHGLCIQLLPTFLGFSSWLLSYPSIVVVISVYVRERSNKKTVNDVTTELDARYNRRIQAYREDLAITKCTVRQSLHYVAAVVAVFGVPYIRSIINLKSWVLCRRDKRCLAISSTSLSGFDLVQSPSYLCKSHDLGASATAEMQNDDV